MNQNISFLTEFGFNNHQNFFESLFRPKMLSLTLPVAILGGFFEQIFGLQPIVFVAFVALLTLELVSGIFASWIEKKEITSRRMKSFLMMLFVWLIVLFVLNSFKIFYQEQLLGKVFSYLFDAVIIFVNVIYFKSIWENAGRIMNRKDDFKKLSDIFSKKLNKD